ncbi:MAG TPA: aminomethyl-transferring glycine dehydrogenase subunit GcvPA [Dehalococcoidia bacterium]|nr:aminomethyl-transferring glycine dehydrogenase subunit GcvPA [Dehalococcoidia bacterium]
MSSTPPANTDTLQPSPDGAHNPYVGTTVAERAAMLAHIGVASADELFTPIPAAYRTPELRLPPPLSEQELLRELSAIAGQNRHTSELISFLGGGAQRHFVPSAVGHIVGRSEFYTAYTPYQPEISQGTLQGAFEFQSLVCELTGMDVANAGMYDGASAFAEACLMAVAASGRRRIALLDSVNPAYAETVRTYASGHGLPVELVPAAQPALGDGHACLAAQQPNGLGALENVQALADAAHAAGALFIVDVDPISLGLLREPGAYGADIVTGSGQGLGGGLNYGGPHAGLFACRERFLRQMPGRIVGQTRDLDGRTGYVLTLQTREQHIRRERATSNICTSQQLLALAAAVYLTLLGPAGLRQVAALCYHKAHYAAERMAALSGFRLASDAPFFDEFALQCPRPPHEILPALLERGILGGIDVSDRVPNGLLIAVTELNPRAEIDALTEVLAQVARL